MINWWQSIVLGIVEGITEFLPISSTGHLTVAEKLMGVPIDDPSITAYTAIIQVGAMIASIIYFWSDIVRFGGAWFSGLRDVSKRNSDYRMGWAIIAGFAVTAVIALLGEPLITGPLRSLWAVVIGLVGWSIVMFIGDRVGKQTRGEDSITVKDGLILGALQSLALVPGVSRSGATITTGDLDWYAFTLPATGGLKALRPPPMSLVCTAESASLPRRALPFSPLKRPTV